MSVIIKGLDMPNTCGQCNLRAFDEWEDEYCTVLCSDIQDHTKRLDSCPLVEIPNPHGRLKDVSELEKDGRFAWRLALTPTILEAEEER